MEKKKILIIDDEEDFTKLVKLNLEQAGEYEVRTENKGLLGVNAAREFKPGLIFLDIMMPDADGGDVCYQLEKDYETRCIPVVFLTAIAKKEEIEESESSTIGGHPFIAKPVNIRELIDCIGKHWAEYNPRRINFK